MRHPRGGSIYSCRPETQVRDWLNTDLEAGIPDDGIRRSAQRAPTPDL